MPDEPRHYSPGTARPTATQYPVSLEYVSRLFADTATRHGFTQVPNFILKSKKFSGGDKTAPRR